MVNENSSLLGQSNDTTDGPKQQSSKKFVPVLLGLLVGVAIGSLCTYYSPRRSSTEASAKRDSKYTATQFVSFSINTLGGLEEYGECDGRFVDERSGMCYLGNKYDLAEDLDHRFKIVGAILEGLANHVSNDTQKIVSCLQF
jgi:hypothetical protein